MEYLIYQLVIIIYDLVKLINWEVVMNWETIKYFDPRVDKMLSCPCCGRCEIDPEFMKRIDQARAKAGIPFKVTSGFRCPEWNKKIKGSAHSSHMSGLALDLSASNSVERFTIVQTLLACGFSRLGIGADFVHVDLDNSKVQSVLWGYY